MSRFDVTSTSHVHRFDLLHNARKYKYSINSMWTCSFKKKKTVYYSMKVVALISGGKDSCFAMMEAIKFGHEIVALANLSPPLDTDELDSWMFQTVGHRAVSAYSECMHLPLFRRTIKHAARSTALSYTYAGDDDDEVEDLFALLAAIKSSIPDVEGVCSGAILSSYQRLRVENICSRLGLQSLAYLWQRDQSELLVEMVEAGVGAILVKCAAMKMNASHLNGECIDARAIGMFERWHDEFGFNVCGEGGEYETFTLRCPLFRRTAIRLDRFEVVVHSDDAFAPVAYLRLHDFTLVRDDDSNVASSPCAQVINVDDFRPSKSTVETSSSDEASSSSSTTSVPLTIESVVIDHGASQWIAVHALGVDAATLSVADEMAMLVDHVERRLDSLRDVYFVDLCLASMDDFGAVNRCYEVRFAAAVDPPSRACVEMRNSATMAKSGARIALQCFAQLASSASRNVLHVRSLSRWAPACIGPYSQATVLSVRQASASDDDDDDSDDDYGNERVERRFHLAGQIALDPPTHRLVHVDDVAAQAALCAKHVRTVLSTVAGNGDANVLLWRCYAVNADDRDAIEAAIGVDNDALVEHVLVSRLPRDALVELQAIGVDAPVRSEPVERVDDAIELRVAAAGKQLCVALATAPAHALSVDEFLCRVLARFADAKVLSARSYTPSPPTGKCCCAAVVDANLTQHSVELLIEKLEK
jgi:diphthine-ammonia ligase